MKDIEQRRIIAACYCRLSDDDVQDGTSVSIETQTKILGDYCREHSIKIHDFYTDDGYTGTNFNRPAFQRMMKDAGNDLINTIIVKDLSRFGREHLQVGNYLQMVFPNMGIRFIAIGDDVDSGRGSLDYDLMIPIKNIFNEYYPADCSRKTRQAFQTKAKNGEFIGSQAPYGYKKSESDKNVLEPDDQTAWVIKWIFEMAAYHGYGYNKIARVLTEKKVINPSANQAQRSGRSYPGNPYEWNLATVYKIFKNETYLGHLISGKRRVASFKNKKVIHQPREDWIIVENRFPAIISKTLWNDAHDKLKTRKRESKTNSVNIFAGLVKCADCGYTLGLSNASNRNNYFVCQTYSKKGKNYCSCHYITYDSLYKTVLADVKQTLRSIKEDKEAYISMVLSKLGDDNDNSRQLMEREISDLKKRIEDLTIKFDRLYEDRLDGFLSDKKFREMAERCETEQNDAEERHNTLLKTYSESESCVENVEKFIQAAEKYENVTALDKELLNRLIKSIRVGNKVQTENGPVQEISVDYRIHG